MRLKIAQLLQNSRKDNLPPFPVVEISYDILSNLAIFSMETADKSPSDLLMPPQNRNLTLFFKIPHKILENMPH